MCQRSRLSSHRIVIQVDAIQEMDHFGWRCQQNSVLFVLDPLDCQLPGESGLQRTVRSQDDFGFFSNLLIVFSRVAESQTPILNTSIRDDYTAIDVTRSIAARTDRVSKVGKDLRSLHDAAASHPIPCHDTIGSNERDAKSAKENTTCNRMGCLCPSQRHL